MLLLWILVLIGIPLVFRLRKRVFRLEDELARVRQELHTLNEQLRAFRREGRAPDSEATPAAARDRVADTPPAPAPVTSTVPPPPVPATPPPVAARPPIERPETTPAPRPETSAAPRHEAPPAPVTPPRPTTPPVFADQSASSAQQPPRQGPPPPPPRREPPPIPPPPPPRPAFAFDWEAFVGVKLFSAIAGIALVLAAIFFLRYSIEQGWLGPPVRVAVGVIVAAALLVVCELKVARRYEVTANALDAAAIAILFATFYAAHALWDLIPDSIAFALLVVVTMLAVLLSIRHDSRFISVLGLLGGFATPALLSTGENRPIPLFAYLLLLNAGLAWVAFKKGWPILTILTLVFTAIYQWGWVVTFLDSGQLSLAMGIFLVFSVMSFAALVLGRRGLERSDASVTTGLVLERTGVAAALMPLLFAVYLASVPQLALDPALLLAFLLLLDLGLLGVAIVRGEEVMHAVAAVTTLVVMAIWLNGYPTGSLTLATIFTAAFVLLYLFAPAIAERVKKPFQGVARPAIYAAPFLLFIFPVLARIDPAAESPWLLFGTLYVLLAAIAWRTLAIPCSPMFFIASFFALFTEAAWSATYLVTERLGTAVALYALFGVFYLGVPVMARRIGRPLVPAWGGGAVVLGSLVMLLFLAAGPRAAAGLWGMAFLLALLNAGLFVESAAGRLPALSVAGSSVSWLVLAVWWVNAADVVGLGPSLIVLVGLTLVMFGGYAWAHTEVMRQAAQPGVRTGFPTMASLGLVGHGFLLIVFEHPEWSMAPWPGLAALLVMTLAASATALFVGKAVIHAGATIAAALIVHAWAQDTAGDTWAPLAMIMTEAVIGYALIWIRLGRHLEGAATFVAALSALFLGELTLVALSLVPNPPSFVFFAPLHVLNLALILWLAWMRRWRWVGLAAVLPAWLATVVWSEGHPTSAQWTEVMSFATACYAVFAAFPFVLGARARASRDPYMTAIGGSVFYFFAARMALLQGGLSSIVGIVPVFEGLVLALLLRALLRIEPIGERDLGRLALVAGAALGFATVAIPLQLEHQWVTVGWALEGAALAWLYRRIPHRGLLYFAMALMTAVFVRLALNPAVFVYEPRGMRVLNWYLYAYLTCSAALFLAAWWFSRTDDRLFPPGEWARASKVLPPAGVILLFILLNIEIADFYATGPEITFRFGVSIAQDLTYTIGWLIFGLGMLAGGIYLHSRRGRMAAVALIAVTTFKAFLYDMGSLEGLAQVASFVGLAISLALVALALQKFVLQAPREES